MGSSPVQQIFSWIFENTLKSCQLEVLLKLSSSKYKYSVYKINPVYVLSRWKTNRRGIHSFSFSLSLHSRYRTENLKFWLFVTIYGIFFLNRQSARTLRAIIKSFESYMWILRINLYSFILCLLSNAAIWHFPNYFNYSSLIISIMKTRFSLFIHI